MRCGLLISMIMMLLAAGLPTRSEESACAPRATVVKRLAEEFGETRQSIGLGANNAVVEVFASPESGTWTITVTLADGTTCLVASGQAYEALAEGRPPGGKDT